MVSESRVGSPLNGALSVLLPPNRPLKPPSQPSCDGLRIAVAPGLPGRSGPVEGLPGAVLPTASSLGVRTRLASRGSLLSFARAALASLRRFTSGSFGQFGTGASAAAAAGGGRSVRGGITSGERSRYSIPV